MHPRFAREATRVYNSVENLGLTGEQVDWIVSGSVKEDADPRYLNHFYNYRDGSGFLIGLPATEWSQMQESALGDFSESAILEAYKNGNKQLAYVGVGHQVHLIEDMAVPAHVRNDPHSPDSYEDWCQKNSPILPMSEIIRVNNLKASIIELAKFTGNNFFSKDSIKEYNPNDRVDKFGSEYYLVNDFGTRVLWAKPVLSGGYKYSFTDELRQDYFNQLAPKAIGYSAGVIDYFQKKFAVIDEERKNESKVLAFFKSLVNFIPVYNSDTAIAWGDTVNMTNITAQLALNDSLREQVMADDVLRNDINNSMLASDPTRDARNDKVVNAIKQGAQKTKVLGEKITSKIIASSSGEKLTINITTPATTFEVGEIGDGEEAEPKTTFKIINPANAEELADVTAPTTFPKFPFTFNGSGGSLNNVPANVEPIVIPEPIIYPDTEIVSNPPMLGSSSMAFFLFDSDQASSTYQYLLDTVGTSSEWLVTSDFGLATTVSDGTHSISVRAIYKGVADETPSEFSWTVDTTPPASIISPLAAYHNHPTFDLSWGRSDLATDTAFYDMEYAVNDDDWLPYIAGTTSTSSFFSQSVKSGDYVHLRIRACDELRNCETWPATESTVTRVGPITPGVATLTSDSITQNSAKINWLSPVDGYLNSEAKYDLRYQKKVGACNLNTTWATASSAPNLPAVASSSGEAVTVTISELEPGSTYCTALRTFNGFNWSTTSNYLEIRTDCAAPTNIMQNYSVKQGNANNIYGPAGAVEPVLLVRLMKQGMTYRAFLGSTCAWNGPMFTISLNSVYGSVEFEYSTSTKLFTGRYRSCGNAYSGNYYSKPDANGFCEDRPTWWGNGRWMGNSFLVGQSAISIAEYFPNSTVGAFTQWLSIQ